MSFCSTVRIHRKMKATMRMEWSKKKNRKFGYSVDAHVAARAVMRPTANEVGATSSKVGPVGFEWHFLRAFVLPLAEKLSTEKDQKSLRIALDFHLVFDLCAPFKCLWCCLPRPLTLLPFPDRPIHPHKGGTPIPSLRLGNNGKNRKKRGQI